MASRQLVQDSPWVEETATQECQCQHPSFPNLHGGISGLLYGDSRMDFASLSALVGLRLRSDANSRYANNLVSYLRALEKAATSTVGHHRASNRQRHVSIPPLTWQQSHPKMAKFADAGRRLPPSCKRSSRQLPRSWCAVLLSLVFVLFLETRGDSIVVAAAAATAGAAGGSGKAKAGGGLGAPASDIITVTSENFKETVRMFLIWGHCCFSTPIAFSSLMLVH